METILIGQEYYNTDSIRNIRVEEELDSDNDITVTLTYDKETVKTYIKEEEAVELRALLEKTRFQ